MSYSGYTNNPYALIDSSFLFLLLNSCSSSYLYYRLSQSSLLSPLSSFCPSLHYSLYFSSLIFFFSSSFLRRHRSSVNIVYCVPTVLISLLSELLFPVPVPFILLTCSFKTSSNVLVLISTITKGVSLLYRVTV